MQVRPGDSSESDPIATTSTRQGDHTLGMYRVQIGRNNTTVRWIT